MNAQNNYPTEQEVYEYAQSMNINGDLARGWHQMMEDNQWKLGQGQPVRNWRTTLHYFVRNGYKLPERVKVEKVEETRTETTTTHKVVETTWHDPMLLLPTDIERERQRQADWQQYLREKGTPEHTEAMNRVLRRFGLLDEAEESVGRP